jgi:hypothetical protein
MDSPDFLVFAGDGVKLRVQALQIGLLSALVYEDDSWQPYPYANRSWFEARNDQQARYVHAAGGLSFQIGDGPVVRCLDDLGFAFKLGSSKPSWKPNWAYASLEALGQPDDASVYAALSDGFWSYSGASYAGNSPAEHLVVARADFFGLLPTIAAPGARVRLSSLAARANA